MENKEFKNPLGLALTLPFFIIALLLVVFITTDWISVLNIFYAISIVLVLTIFTGIIFSLNLLVKRKKINSAIIFSIITGILSLFFFIYITIEVNSYVNQMGKMFTEIENFEGGVDSFEDEDYSEIENVDWEAEMNDALNDAANDESH